MYNADLSLIMRSDIQIFMTTKSFMFQQKKRKLLCPHSLLFYIVEDKLEPLYAPIRHKLGNALNNWHPSDSSAKVILKPWHGVFREGHMEVFLRKHIVPKLEICLQEFPINPHQQTLGNFIMSILFRVHIYLLTLRRFY